VDIATPALFATSFIVAIHDQPFRKTFFYHPVYIGFSYITIAILNMLFGLPKVTKKPAPSRKLLPVRL
jgi:hypothetical protein